MRQVTGSDFLLARTEAGYKFLASGLEDGVSRTGRGQRNRGKEMAAGEMSAQFAGWSLPTFVGRHTGRNARGDAEGMEEPVNRKRVEVARVDLLLLLEDAGGKPDRGEREGFKFARRMLELISEQGLSDGRRTDEAKPAAPADVLRKLRRERSIMTGSQSNGLLAIRCREHWK